MKKIITIDDIVDMLESEVILLESHPKSEGFSSLVDEIVAVSNKYRSEALSEEKLKKVIQKTFIEMKDRYP